MMLLPAGADAAATSAAIAAVAGAPAAGGWGRATPQNWRAGVAAVSRSTPLRRPVADVMAVDALKLVKKWARDRCERKKVARAWAGLQRDCLVVC